jgi:hypothetical protein
MAQTDNSRWIVVHLAEAAGWSAERIGELRAAYSRIAVLAQAQEFGAPEMITLQEQIRVAHRELEANATDEMLRILLAHDEETQEIFRRSRATATGPRAAAIEEGIGRVTTHADEIRERLAGT